MTDTLKHKGFKKAPSIFNYIDKCDTIGEVRDYKEWLSLEPKRSDFIDFDNEGFALNENIPLFKGWEVCEETSAEDAQVAIKDGVRIYFNTNNGVFVMSSTHVSDNLNYNNLFIFFENELELN